MSKLIQVIQTNTARGCGVTYCSEPEHTHGKDCPMDSLPWCSQFPHRHEAMRWVVQYFDPADGTLLAEVDPLPNGGRP